ncbi:unnamed protein product, partial [Meganyctiphanes norvegica]
MDLTEAIVAFIYGNIRHTFPQTPLLNGTGDRPITGASMTMDQDGRPRTRQGEGSTSGGAGRPTTSGRPLTSRPLSAAIRGAPGTASRLISTAAMQRPGTRTGVATGIGFATPISVTDRPITQQGLSGMKTGSRGPQRQVQDKTYFMGLLRTKLGDLSSEIGTLGSEIDSMKAEQSTFLTYDKKVKEMAQELTELQGNLADYNLLVDLVNTDTELGEIQLEHKELKEANDQEAQKLDIIFTRKQELENITKQLEKEIEEERHMGESLVEAMQPELRHKYMELRQVNTSLLQHLESTQLHLDTLDSRKQTLEDELATSKVKQDAVVLYEKLQELEEKRNEIQEENSKRGTPKEERERLLLQVKEDNAEIATMERQVSEVQEHIRRIQEDLHNLDQDLEENQSERSQKYRELRKREETMDTFLESFDSNKTEELQRLGELEENNVRLLEKLSRNMQHFGNLPSSRDFETMRGDLAFKEGELEKSRYTEQGLKQEHLNLQSNLQKIEALESKVQTEMVELKERLITMEKEIQEFSDLNGVKVRAEEKRRNLAEKKEELEIRKASVTQALKDIIAEVTAIKNQLNENETHTQLVNLEKKWLNLEQNNFILNEFVAARRAESNILPVKNQAMKLLQEYNKNIQEVLTSGGNMI